MQLSYVKPNDIIIGDRGYYSNEVINKIIEMNSNFIFRITKNKKFISNIKKNESSAIFNYNHNDKIYKFKIYVFLKVKHSLNKNKFNLS